MEESFNRTDPTDATNEPTDPIPHHHDYGGYGRARRGRPGCFLLVLSLVSALVGGIVVSYLAPFLPALPRGTAPEPKEGDTPSVLVEPVIPNTADGSPAVEVAERVGPAVVGVTSLELLQDFFTGRRLAQETASGSGVIFDSRGFIVTNYHVVQTADRVVIILEDGTRLTAEIVGVDSATDLAVVKVKADEPLTAAVFGDSDQVRVGETVIAIGNPLGLEFQRSITVGVVSGIRSFLYGQEQSTSLDRVAQLIQTDAAINPGNSGGALVNVVGQVIGINTFKLGQQAVEGMGFAIPSNTVKRVVDDLIRYGRVRRAYLGMGFMEREQASQSLGVEIDRGLFIAQVVENGPSSRAGVREGDVLLNLGGVEIDRFLNVIRALEPKRPGDRIELRYLREGREVESEIILGERN